MNPIYANHANQAAAGMGRPRSASDVPPKMAEVPVGLMHVEQVCNALTETAIDLEQRLQTVLRCREPGPSCCKESEPDPQKVSDRLERSFQRLQATQCHLREILERLEL